MTVGRASVAAAAALALTFGVSAAAPILLPATPAAPTPDAEPRTFATCAALSAYVRPQAEAEVVRRAREWAQSNTGELWEQSMDGAGGVAPLDAVGPGSTGSNLQEPGADEPDTSKLDGSRLVTIDLQNGERAGIALRVLDVAGDRPVQLGVLWLPAGDLPQELLLLPDHRALVLGATSDPEPRALLTLVDLADPGHPAVLRRETVTGHYVSARLSDGVVRVAIAAPSRITYERPHEGDSETKALGRGLKTLRVPTGADGLPAREITRGDGTVVAAGPLVGCADVRAPARYSGLGLLSLLTIDTALGAEGLDAGRAVGVLGGGVLGGGVLGGGVLGGGDLVYASPDRFYVATTAVGPDLGDSGGTEIHAFDATGRGGSPYVGSQSVPGYVLGSWAFSEHEGFLRVATTTTAPWEGNAETSTEAGVTVLAERDGRIARVGGISGLGTGEWIRAVRWFGDRGVIVTNAMTDPLYVLDLADPTTPRLTGELKLPGYSAYLHPVGDGRLLAVGQDGGTPGEQSTAGEGPKAQATSFDLGHAEPARLDALGLGAGLAAVESESRAFAYLPDRRLAVVPFAERYPAANGDCNWVPDCVDGAVHRSVAVGILVDGAGRLTETGRYVSPVPLIRVLRSGDRLVAISSASVAMLDLDGLRSLGSAYATNLGDGAER